MSVLGIPSGVVQFDPDGLMVSAKLCADCCALDVTHTAVEEHRRICIIQYKASSTKTGIDKSTSEMWISSELTLSSGREKGRGDC